MKRSQILLITLSLIFVFSLAACERSKSVCTPQATPRATLDLTDLLMTPAPDTASTLVKVEIKGKLMEVDKVVDYPICNDDWSGVVYVTCDAQVAEAALDADENPLFFQGCNLNIEPNTVVYVAAHNDAAYYKGCSCHTGEDPPY
ncbi:MAG: hypothetical protein ISR58_00295 [Anaerolineales bacterium]|nr:hypothetical protein [Chloroflexota bacterium]MBL6979602.1 hypothetical protein [Anaerolineales bacterium]